jgi:hypothetical protein
MSEERPLAHRAADLQESLARDPRVNEPNLRVSVVAGRVHVSGVVPTEDRREAITQVLLELCPDVAVDNRTTVGVPSSEPREERL